MPCKVHRQYSRFYSRITLAQHKSTLFLSFLPIFFYWFNLWLAIHPTKVYCLFSTNSSLTSHTFFFKLLHYSRQPEFPVCVWFISRKSQLSINIVFMVIIFLSALWACSEKPINNNFFIGIIAGFRKGSRCAPAIYCAIFNGFKLFVRFAKVIFIVSRF